MADHVVRRSVAGSGTRRKEPRPTAEISKQQLQGLIRDHAEPPAPSELEAELEIASAAPARLPSASSPRLLAHTLRRDPTLDGLPAVRASSERISPISRTDISTIAMPRVERAPDAAPEAAPDAIEGLAHASSDAVPRMDAVSDTEHTRQHRGSSHAGWEVERIPPAVESFEGDASRPVGELPRTPMFATPPRIDRALARPGLGPRQAAPLMRPRAPAVHPLRVLPITLSIIVAVGAAYLLYSGS